MLGNLALLGKLVGDSDLTCDKDYKHVFKHLCLLLLHNSGSRVGDIQITSGILRQHLRSAGLESRQINAYFDVEDKQDVCLAVNLLKSVWKLEVSVCHNGQPGFSE